MNNLYTFQFSLFLSTFFPLLFFLCCCCVCTSSPAQSSPVQRCMFCFVFGIRSYSNLAFSHQCRSESIQLAALSFIFSWSYAPVHISSPENQSTLNMNVDPVSCCFDSAVAVFFIHLCLIPDRAVTILQLCPMFIHLYNILLSITCMDYVSSVVYTTCSERAERAERVYKMYIHTLYFGYCSDRASFIGHIFSCPFCGPAFLYFCK